MDSFYFLGRFMPDNAQKGPYAPPGRLVLDRRPCRHFYVTVNEFSPRNRARNTLFTTQYLRYGHDFILGDTGTPSRLGRRSGGYNQLAIVFFLIHRSSHDLRRKIPLRFPLLCGFFQFFIHPSGPRLAAPRWVKASFRWSGYDFGLGGEEFGSG